MRGYQGRSPWLRRRCLFYGVRCVLFVVADVLDRFGVGEILELDRDGERLRVGLRIFDGDLDVHMSEVAASELFDGAKRLAVRSAAVVEPALVVEAARVHHKPLA